MNLIRKLMLRWAILNVLVLSPFLLSLLSPSNQSLVHCLYNFLIHLVFTEFLLVNAKNPGISISVPRSILWTMVSTTFSTGSTIELGILLAEALAIPLTQVATGVGGGMGDKMTTAYLREHDTQAHAFSLLTPLHVLFFSLSLSPSTSLLLCRSLSSVNHHAQDVANASHAH